MIMKPSTCVFMFSPCLILFFSLSTSSALTGENFAQCLTTISNSSNPITKAIYNPSNPVFLNVLDSYIRNLRFNRSTTPKPVYIVTAMHESHVQATVVCAKNHSLQLRIRSGGHDYDGLSYVSKVPFVLLDMFNLRSIDIDMVDETAWVQSGATTGELYYRIAEKSKVHAFPAGICTTLGVGGHFSGAGYGNLMRKYGLTVDSVVDAQIVDVNGKILNRKSMGKDLFWAIRGGGAASFGVVLSWKIKLVRVPEKVTVFRVVKTIQRDALDAITQWQKVADKLDEDLFIRINLMQEKGTIKATFTGLFLGDAKRLVPSLRKNFPILGLQEKDCISMSWVETVLFWFQYPQGTKIDVLLDRVPKFNIYVKRKSDYVKKPISREGLETMFNTMKQIKNVVMEWNPYGGKMSNISEFKTPFPHRAGNIFKIQYQANWQEGGSKAEAHYLNITRTLYSVMTPYVSSNPREAYLNYRDVDIGTSPDGSYDEARVYGIKYFKDNFERLVRVKTKVDPSNFFRYEQSIPIAPKSIA